MKSLSVIRKVGILDKWFCWQFTHIAHNFLLRQVEIDLTTILIKTGVQTDKVREPLLCYPGLGGVPQISILPPALQFVFRVTIHILTGEDRAGYWSKVINDHDETLTKTLRKM